MHNKENVAHIGIDKTGDDVIALGFPDRQTKWKSISKKEDKRELFSTFMLILSHFHLTRVENSDPCLK